MGHQYFFRPFLGGIDVFFFSCDVFLSFMNSTMVIKPAVVDGYPISYRQPKSDTI